jgi:hypothetical protein
MINAPACIGEQELTGGQSAIPAICKFALQRALVSESCITPVIQLRLR